MPSSGSSSACGYRSISSQTPCGIACRRRHPALKSSARSSPRLSLRRSGDQMGTRDRIAQWWAGETRYDDDRDTDVVILEVAGVALECSDSATGCVIRRRDCMETCISRGGSVPHVARPTMLELGRGNCCILVDPYAAAIDGVRQPWKRRSDALERRSGVTPLQRDFRFRSSLPDVR